MLLLLLCYHIFLVDLYHTTSTCAIDLSRITLLLYAWKYLEGCYVVGTLWFALCHGYPVLGAATSSMQKLGLHCKKKKWVDAVAYELLELTWCINYVYIKLVLYGHSMTIPIMHFPSTPRVFSRSLQYGIIKINRSHSMHKMLSHISVDAETLVLEIIICTRSLTLRYRILSLIHLSNHFRCGSLIRLLIVPLFNKAWES